ncbi:hypothetical protein PV08_05723 [Exophiala spinifera]|uniref:Uncharacterized protein n=1 Tax=Exophiala spinifera TaxID=91928 RepID=A0A0D2BWL3_9EURO|nr:uncharacterized protein PV08_05723 [Exophiala spinifera]KIW15674.1 hypothetical protein PV08_05723 [Exophiala spinifera]
MASQNHPQESSTHSATLMARLRGSAKKKTSAIRAKLSGCIHSSADGEPYEPASSIHEFLSSTPPVRQHMHEVTAAQNSYGGAWSRCRPQEQLDLRSNHSQANISELSARPSGQFSMSTVSVSSSTAAPGWENPPPGLTSKGEHATFIAYSRECGAANLTTTIERPDEFKRFPVQRHNQTERQANSTLAGEETLGQLVRSSLQRTDDSKHIAELPAAHESVSGTNSTPIRATSTEPSRYQPYPGPGSKKPVSYVIPSLQAGYVHGVPPNLRAGHSRHRSDMTNAPSSQNPHASERRAREKYSWPLVDFEEEMFLNAEPARAGRPEPRCRLPKHQEPRIPDLDFSSGRLEDEVAAMLGALAVDDGASLTGPPITQSGRREAVHEMEAIGPITNFVGSTQVHSRGGDCLPAHRVELEGTRYVTSISPERRRAQQRQQRQRRQSTMSPVSPLSSDGGRVAYHDYNWPRFSEVQRYEDPAGEHSRRYRDRRREMRRDRAAERYR